ncbi:MAG: GNAT family N-acetyltransferase, partial [Bacteroidota bacterium]
YLFEELNYRRVEWKCDNNNLRSKNAALRLGFQYEGLFRKHLIVKSQNRDTAWFAMTDDEWPITKHRLQSYLA